MLHQVELIGPRLVVQDVVGERDVAEQAKLVARRRLGEAPGKVWRRLRHADPGVERGNSSRATFVVP